MPELGGRLRFKTVDGLRGIAAMAVVLFHLHAATELAFGDWLPPILDQIFSNGHYGIDIFFVISGFVIAYSIRSAAPTLGYIRRFALRRSIRLDPPYWAAILLEIGVQSIALHLALSDVPLPGWPKFFAHFLYLQDLLGLGNIIEIFWTLCFEIQFYLALVSMLVLRRKLGEWLGLRSASRVAYCALAVLFVYSVAIRFNVADLSGHPGLATLRWYQFFMGCCVWWVIDDRVGWPVLPLMWVVVAGTVYGTAAPLLELIPIAVSALLLASYRRDRMASWLASRPLQFLGAISYSLYVFHTTIGWRFIRLLGLFFPGEQPGFVPYVAFSLGVIVCIGFAWLAWRILEKPSIELSKRIRLPTIAAPSAQSDADAFGISDRRVASRPR